MGKESLQSGESCVLLVAVNNDLNVFPYQQLGPVQCFIRGQSCQEEVSELQVQFRALGSYLIEVGFAGLSLYILGPLKTTKCLPLASVSSEVPLPTDRIGIFLTTVKYGLLLGLDATQFIGLKFCCVFYLQHISGNIQRPILSSFLIYLCLNAFLQLQKAWLVSE